MAGRDEGKSDDDEGISGGSGGDTVEIETETSGSSVSSSPSLSSSTLHCRFGTFMVHLPEEEWRSMVKEQLDVLVGVGLALVPQRAAVQSAEAAMVVMLQG
jgi:hypothetical protein